MNEYEKVMDWAVKQCYDKHETKHMVKTTRTHYKNIGKSLEKTINEIGYENILQILSCYGGCGECYYTIIYKGECDIDED